MSHHFTSRRSYLAIGLAAGLVGLALAGQPARAGNISITISQGGLPSIQVGLDFGNFGAGTTANNVVADTGALNALLDAFGFDFNFNALGAISNSPASGVNATLLLTGQVFRTTAGGGDQTITIDASQNDYTTLASAPGTLTSFSTANFVPGGGISQIGTSYFATSNTQDDTSGLFTTAPTLTPPGGSATEPPLPVPSTPVFSLTNRVVITLPGDTTGGSSPPVDQFTHSTTVTAVIPEPASVAMLGMGLPVAFMGLRWLRRRRVSAIN
ncbi:PEP-CTERM sorting domain-containing protein [Aquisphaera insulae]|uniref:PEP-CTERM sorting domain-containing protein n=1 Tax=Aquisphaera insulae TaxID=2712864 RepID=UPI0013ECF882|nr:PEP-CTERM sorting domain-containing protein [Aquisphaera insulae]